MLSTMLTTELLPHQPVRPLRVEQFDQLVESGAFADDERVELLFGVLYLMDREEMESGEHIWITQRVMKRLVVATLDLPLEVICQSSVKMGDYHVPMPDITVVSKQAGFERPRGGRLVVEIAKSSLRTDREVKERIYSVAGVREYWIVDVEHERVFVYSEPHGEAYARLEVVPRTGVLKPLELPGLEITVDELFQTTE